MTHYKIIIKIRGHLSIPIVNDTLMGHIAWAIALTEGEDALSKFLNAYEEGSPPLILSHAFPHDWLPAPVLLQTPNEKESKYSAKDIKKTKFVPASVFKKKIVSWDLILEAIQHSENAAVLQEKLRTRNSINRMSGLVEEGSLWTKKELHPSLNPDDLFDVYALSIFDTAKLRNILETTFKMGYGGDASVGSGYIEISEILEEPLATEGSRAMALGHFVPGPKEAFSNLYSNITVRKGKLGPIFALTMNNPFKKPIIFYDAGTTFDSHGSPYVGSIIKDVHTDPRIRSFGLAPVIGFSEA